MKGPFATALAAVALAAAATNPITPEGTFFSDPAPRTAPDGKLWLFGSRDILPHNYGSRKVSPHQYCSRSNDALSTTNLVDWTLHKDVLKSAGPGDGVPGTDAPLYAPDAIFHNGKWRLFYCMPDRNHREGVAEADSPAGPYSGARKLPGFDQIDPSVFLDSDGALYYFYGQFSLKGCILDDTLSGPRPGTFHAGIIDEARHNFHEGVQILKRGDTWYLVFADIGRRHRPTCIGYATAKSPFGPYTYRGVIVDNHGCDPKSWNNHGGIVEYKGRWFVFYHRSTNCSNTMRKACVEPIEFDAYGLIREVPMTSNGAGPALSPFAETPARISSRMEGNVRVTTEKNGHELLTGIRSGDSAEWRYFAACNRPLAALELKVIPQTGGWIELCDDAGKSYGRVSVPAGDGKTPVSLEIAPEPLPGAGLNGLYNHGNGRGFAVILRFHGRTGKDLMKLESFRFK